MKHFITQILGIALFFSATARIYASNPDSTNNNIGLVASYRGTIRNTPGLSLGIEKYYFQTSKYAVIGSASIILNQRPQVFTSAGILLSNSLRRTGKKGIYIEHAINAGYLGRYYNFDVFETNSDGNIVNIGKTLKSSIVLGYSIGLGYDFSKMTNTNIKIFLKPGIYYDLLDKSNIYTTNNYSIEAGIVYMPHWLKKNK